MKETIPDSIDLKIEQDLRTKLTEWGINWCMFYHQDNQDRGHFIVIYDKAMPKDELLSVTNMMENLKNLIELCSKNAFTEIPNSEPFLDITNIPYKNKKLN